LSGAGGDELFAGYPWRYFRPGQSPDMETYIRRYYGYWQRLLDEPAIKRLFQPWLLSECSGYRTIDVFKNVLHNEKTIPGSPVDYINKSLYFEIKTFLHGLFLVEDKLSMANGVETRVPFMDNDLVDFASRVPVRFKLNNLAKNLSVDENLPGPQRMVYQTGDGKMILRKALSRYVPESIINQKKQGFSAPDASWFKGESIDYIRDLLLTNRAKINDFFEPAVTRQLIEEHVRGEENHRLLIWSLLSFEWWCRLFL
ncbi:MAG TPA: asparagine synthetase B, partial [Proteobacteria bacterium]|nr:asparagine synthetase B [Pseudomonadota bacterium]